MPAMTRASPRPPKRLNKVMTKRTCRRVEAGQLVSSKRRPVGQRPRAPWSRAQGAQAVCAEQLQGGRARVGAGLAVDCVSGLGPAERQTAVADGRVLHAGQMR